MLGSEIGTGGEGEGERERERMREREREKREREERESTNMLRLNSLSIFFAKFHRSSAFLAKVVIGSDIRASFIFKSGFFTLVDTRVSRQFILTIKG